MSAIWTALVTWALTPDGMATIFGAAATGYVTVKTWAAGKDWAIVRRAKEHSALLGKIEAVAALAAARVKSKFADRLKEELNESPAGVLNEQQKSELRAEAWETMKDIGPSLGLDVAKAVLPDVGKAAIERAVQGLKGKAILPLSVTSQFPD